jgi:hypothetical protein
MTNEESKPSVEKGAATYVSRNFDAVDAQIKQVADREKVITDRLKIQNYWNFARVMLLASMAVALVILAIGIALWLWGGKKDVVFVDKPFYVVKDAASIDLERQMKDEVESDKNNTKSDSSNPIKTSFTIFKTVRVTDGKKIVTGYVLNPPNYNLDKPDKQYCYQHTDAANGDWVSKTLGNKASGLPVVWEDLPDDLAALARQHCKFKY